MSEAAAEAVADAPEAGPAEAAYLDENVLDVLATKIMGDWLRNRQQLLVPLTLDLQKLEEPAADMLLHAMVAAAQADGTLDASDRTRLDAALRVLNASDAQRARLDAAFDHPRALADVLSAVTEVKTGAMLYAVSLLALDRRKRVNRYFLRYLGERLQLSDEVRASLEQRFTSAG